MAAHHHHHHHQSPPPPTTCCSYSSGYTCSCNCNNTHHCSPPSPSPSSIDPLLQAIASQVLQSTPLQPQQLYSYFSKSQTQNPKLHHPKLQRWRHQQKQEEETHLLISSLLSRIEALEASLHHLSLDRSHHYSLRDVAARVIQTQFRAFLVRRSRTLRELKDLALVKSAFSSLKSSLSNEIHFDFQALSRKAMDLLIKLDSIQGDDSMVRDGKRSISRDLVRFLEFIDGIAVKRHELSIKARNNVRFGRNSEKSRVNLSRSGFDLDGDQREVIGKLRERVEKIRGYSRVPQNDDEDVEFEGFQHVCDEDNEVENPIVVISGKNGRIRNGVLVNKSGDQPRVKKSVSFAENEKLFKVFSNSNEPISNEDDSTTTTSSDDHGEVGETIGAEVEEIKGFSLGTEGDEEEGDVVNGGSSQTSNGERNTRAGGIIREGNFKIKGHNGEFVFSAPLPVQMEDKADLMKWRNEVKILR